MKSFNTTSKWRESSLQYKPDVISFNSFFIGGPMTLKLGLLLPFHNATSIIFCRAVRRGKGRSSIKAQKGQNVFLTDRNGDAPSVFVKRVRVLNSSNTSGFCLMIRQTCFLISKTSNSSVSFLILVLRWCKLCGTLFGFGRSRLKSDKSSLIALSGSLCLTTKS